MQKKKKKKIGAVAMLQVDLNNKILLIKYTFRFLLSSTQYIVQVVFMPLEEFNTT
jgi:hypothetical protein